MKKVDINLDNKINIDKIINDLKKDPLFSNINIDISNLNSCLIMKEENDNCKNCQGLNKCLNNQAGFKLVYEENTDCFLLKKCRLKQELDAKIQESSLIKTLYMPKSVREASLEKFSLDTPERKEIYKKVVNFITNYDVSHKLGLYIYGNYGCGKTYILGALAKELATKNIDSLLIYFPDLIRELKDSLNDDRFSSLINELKDVDVLMLDDVGSENMTTFVRDEILGPVLNYRMAEEKPLFISSNLTPEQLLSHLSLNATALDKTKAMRIMSRISQISELVNMGRRKYDGTN